jgi:hypothetical protein
MSASGDESLGRSRLFQNLANVHALLVERDAHAARETARVLRGVVGTVDVRDSYDAIERHGLWDIALVNYDQLASLERERIFTRFAELNGAGGLLLCTAQSNREELVALFGRYKARKLLARNGPVHVEDLLITTQKTLRHDLFGLDKYLGWGASARSVTVKSSADKEAVLSMCEQFAAATELGSRKTAMLLTVGEELTSNALYDAPVDAAQRARHADLPRSERVELAPGEAVVVTVASDGRRLGISVEDPFGSLRAETVVDYLAKCLRKGQDQIDRKPGGAGLGLFYAFNSLSQFVVNIEPKKRTEMIGLIDVAGSHREFEQRVKSFNVFVEE